MKILQLCKKFPYPLNDGEAIALYQISKSLVEAGCEITLLAMNTTKHHVDLGQIDREALAHYKAIFTVDVDNKIYLLDAIQNLFSKESFHISRFISQEFAERLIDILNKYEFDIIQLETPYLAPYLKIIKAHSHALVVMRAHNIEHEIWERIASNIKFIPKKWYLTYLSQKLKRFEIDTLNEYDLLVAITERDMLTFKKLGYKNGCIAFPVSFDTKSYEPNFDTLHPIHAVSFIGSLDWMPNILGLEWFINEVWPAIRAVQPSLEFHFAGRNAPSHLSNIQVPGVTYQPMVQDAKAFINTYPIMVTPLFAASGIRVKILEAMALGRVVISTTIGLEGIPAVNHQHVIIADTAQEFVDAIQWCIADPASVKKIGLQASEFVRQEYDNRRQAQRLLDTYRTTLRQHCIR